LNALKEIFSVTAAADMHEYSNEAVTAWITAHNNASK